MNDDTALELGGGALALLALGAAAAAMARRRRRREEEAAYTEVPYAEPVPVAEPEVRATARAEQFQPPIVAPQRSAFAWGNKVPREDHVEKSIDDDRNPGETWVERAYRGPTADNPSLSLRKRLKRAAFFDKREEEAAQHRAVPVEADAGLPEAMEVDERDLVDA